MDGQPTLVMCKPLPSPHGSPTKDASSMEQHSQKSNGNTLLLPNPKPPPPPVPRQSAKPKRDPFDFYHYPKSVRQVLRESGDAPADDPGEDKLKEPDSGSTWRQLLAVVAINLVTFLQGASIATSTISTVVLKEADPDSQGSWPRDFRITEQEATYINLSWLVGHLLSGILANPVAEIIGRKRSLLLDTAAFALGFAVYSVGESTVVLCIGRLILGYPLVSTVYTNELVHPELRGVSAAVYAICHAAGTSLLLLLGALLPHWRFGTAALAALAVPTFVAILFLPESPVWLIRREKEDEAEQSLKKMRGPSYDVENELEDMKVAVELNNCKDKLSVKDVLWLMYCKKFRLPFSFLVVLFVAIGWSGFAYLANDLVSLFKGSTDGKGFVDENFLAFLVSLTKIPGGLLAAVFLKRFPRRPVFIACALIVAVGHSIMAMTSFELIPKWGAIVALVLGYFGYSAGYNSVAVLLMGEILPAILRSVGVGLVVTAEGLSTLALIALAPKLEDVLGRAGLFIIFATVVFLAAIYALCLMPETSGLTLEQIENIWQSDKHPKCVVRRNPQEELRRMSAHITAPAHSMGRALSHRMSMRRSSVNPRNKYVQDGQRTNVV